ncbi:hypothetical protein D6C83_07293 [Aureobasidium pullulans]|uniref:Uncharacterized protein n=2 Tax=Aureobasidium pullulans TaxID=5580 RepID=A0A4T0B627_AURPU|nr:hypothetical protein D6C83_07293 [Aureobasidium pullulans]
MNKVQRRLAKYTHQVDVISRRETSNMVQPTSISPAFNQTKAMAATRRGLTLLPLENKLEILAYILDAQAHQIIPSPLLQLSRYTRRTALRQLAHDITLQLDIHHASYSRFWEVSFTSATAPVLRSPSQPHLVGRNALWPNFRGILNIEEVLGRVHKLYIKFSCFRELAFSIEFAAGAAPRITVHATTPVNPAHPMSPGTFVFNPSVQAWTTGPPPGPPSPGSCDISWIEAFLTDMRNACEQQMTQQGASYKTLFNRVLVELRMRQPYPGVRVQLRKVPDMRVLDNGSPDYNKIRVMQPFRGPYPVKRLRGEEMNAMMHKKMHELKEEREKKRAAAQAARMKRVSLVVRFR